MRLQEWLDSRYTKEEILKIDMINTNGLQITSLECDYELPDLIYLRCNNNNITSLKGIHKYFPNLLSLMCANNKLPLLEDINTNNLHLISDINRMDKIDFISYIMEDVNNFEDIEKDITV